MCPLPPLQGETSWADKSFLKYQRYACLKAFAYFILTDFFFPTMNVFIFLSDTEADSLMPNRNDFRIFCTSKPP